MDERMKRRAALYMLIKLVDENNGSNGTKNEKMPIIRFFSSNFAAKLYNKHECNRVICRCRWF